MLHSHWADFNGYFEFVLSVLADTNVFAKPVDDLVDYSQQFLVTQTNPRVNIFISYDPHIRLYNFPCLQYSNTERIRQ